MHRLLLAALAGAGFLLAQAEPLAWRFAHPDARIVAGVDFKRLSETATGRELRARFAAALGDPLVHRADRLLLSSVLDAAGRRSDLLILSGAFERAELRKIAAAEGATVRAFQGLEIAAPPASTAADPHLAWITGQREGTLILVGTRAAIQAAAGRITARDESMASANPLFQRGLELSRQFPVWVVCDALPAGFGPKSLDDAEDEGMDFGLRLAAAAELNLWVWTSSEQAAADVLARLQQSAASQETFVLTGWLSSLQGTLDGTTLALGAVLPLNQVAERVPPLLAAFALPIHPREPSAKVEINQPPATPAKKLFVRIEGLESGSMEIVYPAPK